MRKLIVVLAVVLSLSLCAMAADAPKAEVFGGYSYVRADSDIASDQNVHGWNAEIMGNVNKYFAVVADFDGHYKDDVHLHTFTFGPQLSYRAGKLAPFAHALFGVSHATAPGGFSENAFAMFLGGGADATLSDHFGLRLFQADWMRTRFDILGAENQDSFRLSTGVLIRF